MIISCMYDASEFERHFVQLQVCSRFPPVPDRDEVALSQDAVEASQQRELKYCKWGEQKLMSITGHTCLTRRDTGWIFPQFGGKKKEKALLHISIAQNRKQRKTNWIQTFYNLMKGFSMQPRTKNFVASTIITRTLSEKKYKNWNDNYCSLSKLKALEIVHFEIIRSIWRYHQHQGKASIFLFLYVYFWLSHKNRLLTTQCGVNYCLLGTALVT